MEIKGNYPYQIFTKISLLFVLVADTLTIFCKQQMNFTVNAQIR